MTLHDEGVVELWDLSSNFVFSENDVGNNRALASVQKLQELNNAVVVHTLTTELKKEQLSDFQVLFSCLLYKIHFVGACLDVPLNVNDQFSFSKLLIEVLSPAPVCFF